MMTDTPQDTGAALTALAQRIMDNSTPHDHSSVRFPRSLYAELVQAVRKHRRTVAHPDFPDGAPRAT